MKEYEPSLESRRRYAREVAGSEFRRTLWNVIVALNPNKHDQLPKFDPLLNIRQNHYSVNLPEFRSQASGEAQKSCQGDGIVKSSHSDAGEASTVTWQGAFRAVARQTTIWSKPQCIAFRVRLFQYLLAMDQHANANPPRKPAMDTRTGQKNNEWNVGWSRRMLDPADAQYQRIKAIFHIKLDKEQYLQKLDAERKRAVEQFQLVLERHSGTPWARPGPT